MSAAVMNRTKLEDLINLAGEPSSVRRRELLREVTDLFFVPEADHGPREMAVFDEVLTALARDMETEVQAELAQRMAEAQRSPRTLVRTLATAPIKVAEPLLASSALTHEDLLHVVETQGQDHLKAVSRRRDLPAAISDVIVERGDDHTLEHLLRNQTAALSRKASETVVERAVDSPALHEAVVARQSLPVDLLNEMYFVVEARLRETIISRNAAIDPETLEAALEAGRKRLAARDGALPSDYGAAESHVKSLKQKNALTPAALVSLLRGGRKTAFLVALCDLTGVDFHTARRIVERRDLDALAIVCKAAGFERALFLTFAVLILDPREGMGRAEQYGRLYSELPKDAALRTMRFWRMRLSTGDVAAA